MTSGAMANEAGSPDRSTAGRRAEPTTGAPAILMVRDDDVRLILRGILALDRHPVVLETTSAEIVRSLATATGRELLIFDAGSGAEPPWKELADALSARPALRPIVLLPPKGKELRVEAERAGAKVVVSRPFALRDLRQAIEQALGRDR